METPHRSVFVAIFFATCVLACATASDEATPATDSPSGDDRQAYAVSKEVYDAFRDIDPNDPQWLERLFERIPPPSDDFEDCIQSVLPLAHTAEDYFLRAAIICHRRHGDSE